jgi:hypothetical protein
LPTPYHPLAGSGRPSPDHSMCTVQSQR